jgi:hypothetical protein
VGSLDDRAGDYLPSLFEGLYPRNGKWDKATAPAIGGGGDRIATRVGPVESGLGVFAWSSSCASRSAQAMLANRRGHDPPAPMSCGSSPAPSLGPQRVLGTPGASPTSMKLFRERLLARLAERRAISHDLAELARKGLTLVGARA